MRSLSSTSSPSYGAILTICSLFVVMIFGIWFTSTAQAATSRTSADERLISIHDNGKTRGIVTKADTLREAFAEADIAIDPNDMIEPGLDSPLVATQYDVNIYRARPVMVIDGSVRKKVMSAYQTPEQIVKHADITLNDEDETELTVSQDIVSQGAGLQLTIERATPFTLVLYGEKIDAYTQQATVADMLKAKDIVVGEADTLSVALNTPMSGGMVVELWRNGKQTVTETQRVAFPIEQVQDVNQPLGYKKITTPGEDGTKSVSYEIDMKNGVEVSRTEIQSTITKEPKKQVEVVGAKFNYTGGPLNEEQITFLGTCESGMTPTRNSGNGFYGAFQFMPSTWRAVHKGPYAMPHEAPLDVQKQAVQDLLSRSSIFTQFPGCAKKMRAAGILSCKSTWFHHARECRTLGMDHCTVWPSVCVCMDV